MGKRPRWFWVRRVAIATLMALASANIFTGAPLAALWVGSQVQGGNGLTMGAVFAVIATLAAVVLALAGLLSVLGRRYDELIGRPPKRGQQAPWLRSMRGERPHEDQDAADLSALEKALIGSVVLGVLAFEAWFFFVAGSPLPRGS